MNSMTIGEVAKRTGLTKKAIRVYENANLIGEPSRGINGYRYYSNSDLLTLSKVATFRSLGMSLQEIKEAFDSSELEVLLRRKEAMKQESLKLLESMRLINNLISQQGKSSCTSPA